MQTINVILDYKGRFESKYTAVPYRSGFDKELLAKYFNDYGYETNYITYPDIDFRNNQYEGQLFLYCSSEERDAYYKSYIEDIILGLKISGAILIPDFIYLRAQNNKIFMEILRDLSGKENIRNITSKYFGTIEDLYHKNHFFSNGSFVIKPSMGAMSEGITCASDFNKIISRAKTISRTRDYSGEIKDLIRKIKHLGYIPDSKFKRKFIIQELVHNLNGDWKILIYQSKYYVLKRKNRKNDFRASGSGLFSYEDNLPEGLLDFARNVYASFNTPTLSIDVGYDGKNYFLIEFQSLYFGSYTIEHSEFHFTYDSGKWQKILGASILEEEYARSISGFIRKIHGFQTHEV